MQTAQIKAVSRRVALVVLGMFALLAVGCATSLNHVGALSQASADLAKRAADAYDTVNETTIDRRIVAIPADTNSLPDQSVFEELLVSSDLANRVALLKGVEKYATALGDLASADFRKEIDTAAKDLYGALGELQNTYTKAKGESLPLSENNLAIIATAVDAIGTAIAESKRRSALKAVVIQADPAISNAMALVAGELPKFHAFVLANLDTVETEMLVAYRKEAPKLTFEDRVARLRNIRDFHEAKKATARVLVDLGKAGAKIASAHSSLRTAVEGGKFTTPELIKEIKGVVALGQSFKEFHDKLLEGNADK